MPSESYETATSIEMAALSISALQAQGKDASPAALLDESDSTSAVT